jgi:carbon-monoxide dehydrogenase large subunit
MGTYGSRSGAVGMTAISKALDKIEAKARKVAAHVMEASESDVEFKDGSFSVKGTDKKMAFGEVALSAYVAHKFPTSEGRAGPQGRGFPRSDQLYLPGGLPYLRTGSGHAIPVWYRRWSTGWLWMTSATSSIR